MHHTFWYLTYDVLFPDTLDDLKPASPFNILEPPPTYANGSPREDGETSLSNVQHRFQNHPLYCPYSTVKKMISVNCSVDCAVSAMNAAGVIRHS